MKKIIILLALLSINCVPVDNLNPECQNSIIEEPKYYTKQNNRILGVGNIKEINYEGCEYIFLRTSLTHKGNCKNHLN